jgi:nitroreductase
MTPTLSTPLDTLTAIEQRRSVKHYDPEFQMPQTDKQRILELALLSPTSFNIQNWRFVVVEDPAQRQKIRQAAWNQAQITDASLLVVLCADLNAWAREPERYWETAPEPVRERLVSMIGQFYKDQPQLQRDEAHRSCGIAAQTLMLAAKAMGYDSCPMVGYDPTQVAEIIQLPDDHIISLIVVIGKATQPAQPRGGAIPTQETILFNHF